MSTGFWRNSKKHVAVRPSIADHMSMTLTDTIPANTDAIRLARLKRRLTLTEAAQFAGFSRSTYHMIEQGRRPVTKRELSRIAGMCRVKLKALQ